MSNIHSDISLSVSGAPALAQADSPPVIAPWIAPIEEHPRRWIVYPCLLLLGVLIAYQSAAYYVPSHGGTDQNGYLATARLILEQHTLHFIPESPFQFVGRMMVLTDDGKIYAKYPFGYPLLAAVARHFGGADAMFMVNPICTALACFFSFFLFRSVLGNFASLMGVICMACNPVTLVYANDANSHAPTLLCVVVGFWGLMTWWQKGRAWRGFIGGLALGYACTVRYTEFLLVLPILFATLGRARFRLRQIPLHLAAIIGWAIPILAMSIQLWISFGAPWRTGYSLCREQTGFGLEYLLGGPEPDKQGNWATLLYQLNHTGLFLLWPAALGGMLALFGHSWRLASLLALWIVPSTLLYLFYYWAPTGETTTGYLRFFLTVFPGMLLAGLWVLDRGLNLNRFIRALSLGGLTFLAAIINVDNISPQLENSVESRATLWYVGQTVERNVPAGSVIFADQSIDNYLDEIGRWTLYDTSLFAPRAFEQYYKVARVADVEDPNPLQRARAEKYMKLLGVKKPDGTWRSKPMTELDRQQMAIVEKAIKENRRVFFIFGGPPPRNMLASGETWTAVPVATLDPPPRAMPDGLQTRFRAGRLVKSPPAPPLNTAQRKQRVWTIQEVKRLPLH